MAEDSDLEKTEPASSRRLQQAREEGQVPRSREIGAFLILFVSAMAFWLMGAWMIERVSAVLRRGLSFEEAQLRDPHFILIRLADISFDTLISFAPFLAALVVAALISPFFLGSWNFTLKALTPDIARMNPMSGLSRMVSWSGLAELFKAVAKSLLVGGVAVWVLWSERNDIVALSSQTIDAGLYSAGHLINFSFLMIVLAMLVIVATDVPFQLWQFHNKLKMTKEEVRQESKEMEGNPEVKGRIRRLQREAARRRMMAAVPTADVIVTNPTHFAVALAYKSGMPAPKVLAKGMGNVALKIREIGAAHGVPMLEAAPLARALHRYVDIDQEIPSSLYAAVAEVLAYVYQLANWRKVGGQYPIPPREISIPDDMKVEVAYG
ncbi:flagellar biosynthesis protein FlhB [Propionivibrio limicola]|uniref:flagellar biosynthesis protein FlhB n=1 Tax=Propionivibrio limicola TaxID=167645 RepID=UPI0012911B46|nr:flagellar biosynthesis protein FlhB [Propionivibrio limicola]